MTRKTTKTLQPTAHIGRDELNLIEVPFALPNKKNKKPGTQDLITTITREWIEKGKKKYYTITGSAAFGLPTTYAAEVYIAALELTYRQEFKSREVHATKQDFLELMGWHDNGQYRARLIRAFKELAGTKIFTNTFWDHLEGERSKSAEGGFGLIDDFRFYDTEEHKRKVIDGEKLPAESYFRWNEVLFKSFSAGFIRRLDTRTYFALSLPIAKTLFRIAGKVTYKKRSFESDLKHFAFDRLLMSANYKQPSKIIQKIKPSIKELQEKAPEFEIKIVKSKTTKSKYKIIIRLRDAQAIEPEHPIQQSSAPNQPRGIEDLNPDEKSIAIKLQTLGIADTKTTGPVALIKNHGISAIRYMVETCEYLESKQKPLPPPGVIVQHLRDGKLLDAYYDMRNDLEKLDTKQFLIDNFSRIWETRKGNVTEEVEAWAELPLEERIDFGKLDTIEASLRKLRKNKFSENSRAERIQGLTKHVPSFERKLQEELEIARKEIQREAISEGLSLSDIQFV
jgi:hypothetical protein